MKRWSFPSVSGVCIRDHYFAPRIRRNRTATIPAVLALLESSGRIRAFDMNWKPGDPDEPHCFWDSDVAKTVEGMALELQNSPDPELEKTLNDLVRRIISAQQPDGYLNTHITLVDPESRWKNLAQKHELYCAGHLMEAAVEHFYATGRRDFLDAMCRYADYIASVFGHGEGQLRGYPGHQEIELALCKLAEATGQEKYLHLAKYFIDERGQDPNYFVREGVAPEKLFVQQAHKPVREQTEAEGHAVRAGYMYAGMADVAAATGDTELFAACERLFENLAGRRMYISGGIGSHCAQERIGLDYQLPNDTAYAESCATISLVFFAARMLNITGNARYADVMEQAMYNGVFAGISLDGKAFFYQNVLEANEQSVPSPELHFAPVRQTWFSCSCCPTSFSRFLPQIGRYLWSVSAEAVRLNIPAAGEYRAPGRYIRVSGKYPYEGAISIEFPEGGDFEFALRIPGWCRRWSLRKNGKKLSGKPVEGYISCGRNWRPGDVVELDLEMVPRIVYAHERVHENAGRAALMRGPLLYAFESTDNAGDCLSSLLIPEDPAVYRVARVRGLPAGTVALKAAGFREVRRSEALYGTTPPALRKCTVTAIPYAMWENRGPCSMQVWMRKFAGERHDVIK
ncbi:MAG: glycoside hydrolase family 127 protein [Lentisphaeria bacterium]|nr:glycoside hydrolase family 127 protein [Lentisphaeria bacterium]